MQPLQDFQSDSQTLFDASDIQRIEQQGYDIAHHGAVSGVTGSCHELRYLNSQSEIQGILVDCGLFQGAEVESATIAVGGQTSGRSNVGGQSVGGSPRAEIKAGSAGSLPAIKSVGGRLRAINTGEKIKKTILFSGDLGAPHTPILKAPKSPFGCDVLVMESTYGDKNHENRKQRRKKLKNTIEKALVDNGTVLIPAFSIGRTQELLYELEEIIHSEAKVNSNAVRPEREAVEGPANQHKIEPFVLSRDAVPSVEGFSGKFGSAGGSPASENVGASHAGEAKWQNLEIIIDSPLAAKFTKTYGQLTHLWDKEARRKLRNKRDPLRFENVLTINDHKEHMQTVNYLTKTARPAIVIAASGMCNGGRIMNYLKAMLNDKRHNVLFVGYQASGTLGRLIQKYGPRGGYVDMDGERITIKSGIETIGGYSAHAGQKDLLNFVKRMWRKPKEIRLVHGDDRAKQTLKQELEKRYPKAKVWVPEK